MPGVVDKKKPCHEYACIRILAAITDAVQLGYGPRTPVSPFRETGSLSELFAVSPFASSSVCKRGGALENTFFRHLGMTQPTFVVKDTF